ncbi:MAG TPA: NADP-dependent oxidoreductase [Planctomycetota bacterium]|nr:NADP-dependent oxidoreductase [Planctomycetota bacterium]
MKAMRIHSYGHADQMKLEETPRPAVRSAEALIKIRAAGVNPVDWKIREGYLKNVFRASFPLTLGQDFAGDVVETGTDIRDFKVGEKVFGFASGTYAEYTTLSAKDLVRMPATTDYTTAASIPTAGLTAYQLVVDVVKAAKDQRILIHGAAGGVGAFAVQLARWKQARVFVTASSQDVAYLKTLGAEQVIDYRSERFEQMVRDMDAVVDLIGGETLARSYQVLKRGGIIVSTVAAPDEAETRKRQLRGQGFMMNRDSSQLVRLAALVDQGVLKPKVSQVLPLSEAPKAHELNEKGKSRGKIVLQVA